MTKKQVFYGVVVIVIIAALWWYFSARTSNAPAENRGNNQQNQQGNQNSQNNQQTQPTEQEMNSGSPFAEGGTTAVGTLQLSDKPARGKLMLVTADRTVYIFTSRDYSSLIGKEVVMHYEGTLDDFMLGDIVAK